MGRLEHDGYHSIQNDGQPVRQFGMQSCAAAGLGSPARPSGSKEVPPPGQYDTHHASGRLKSAGVHRVPVLSTSSGTHHEDIHLAKGGTFPKFHSSDPSRKVWTNDGLRSLMSPQFVLSRPKRHLRAPGGNTPVHYHPQNRNCAKHRVPALAPELQSVRPAKRHELVRQELGQESNRLLLAEQPHHGERLTRPMKEKEHHTGSALLASPSPRWPSKHQPVESAACAMLGGV